MTSYTRSVAAVVLRDGKVLLARHTYGAGEGKLIVPGGYVEGGESPTDAVRRELREETGIAAEPTRLLAIRFNTHDWYAAFAADYVSGEARSDGDENSEVVWLDAHEALERDDVPQLTKRLIECALKPHGGLVPLPYDGSPKHAPNLLYGIE